MLQCADQEASQIFIVNERALDGQEATYQNLRVALADTNTERSPNAMVLYTAMGDDRYERIQLDQLPPRNLTRQSPRAKQSIHRFAVHVDVAALAVDD